MSLGANVSANNFALVHGEECKVSRKVATRGVAGHLPVWQLGDATVQQRILCQ